MGGGASNSTRAAIDVIFTNHTLGSDATEMVFYTSGGGIVDVDRLRLNSNGDVGVGSSTPWGGLSVDQLAGQGRLKPIFVV